MSDARLSGHEGGSGLCLPRLPHRAQTLEQRPWAEGQRDLLRLGKGSCSGGLSSRTASLLEAGVPGSHRDTELVVGGLCKGFQVMLEIAS